MFFEEDMGGPGEDIGRTGEDSIMGYNSIHLVLLKIAPGKCKVAVSSSYDFLMILRITLSCAQGGMQLKR